MQYARPGCVLRVTGRWKKTLEGIGFKVYGTRLKVKIIK
jgi:hypothetical protein